MTQKALQHSAGHAIFYAVDGEPVTTRVRTHPLIRNPCTSLQPGKERLKRIVFERRTKGTQEDMLTSI
ncbi:MAG TPA: hypothetical protein VIY29_15735, partial [Ktedonobacteraceae bacterium]